MANICVCNVRSVIVPPYAVEHVADLPLAHTDRKHVVCYRNAGH
jgi:hypothetical protein